MPQSPNNTNSKKKVAVIFGGRSPEHDVSVVSGLQVLGAIDAQRYEAFPVYISPDGKWYVGDILRQRDNYLLSGANLKSVTEVTLDVCVAYDAEYKGRLLPKKKGFLQKGKPIEFDVALLSFHGLYGEDGNIQGLMELANVPYTGMRTMGTSVLMDKVATKHILESNEIPCLPYAYIKRPTDGGYKVPLEEIERATKHLKFPACLKPSHLGSSIGVAKVENAQDIQECLPAIFQFDDTAILEPFVENLVEYNVAVSKISGEVKFSAIERPKTTDELLDFKQKYLSGADDKGGNKTGTKTADTAISEGMLSLTRELNPDLPQEVRDNIKLWAAKMFEAVSGTGAPRIDFIGNSKTGELWMNEVNPIPGSFGYFLWEAAEEQLLFMDLLSSLIEEALYENKAKALPRDPVPKDARLLKRGR